MSNYKILSYSMESTVIALCISGLGNKINSLIGGLYWSNKLEYNFKFAWQRDSECMCCYSDIFTSYTKNNISFEDISNIDHNTMVVTGSIPRVSFITSVIDEWNRHESIPRKIKKLGTIDEKRWILTENIPDNQNIIKKHSNVIYQDSALPSYIKHDEVVSLLSQFKINKKILSNVKNFVNKNNIDRQTTGIMLRKHIGVNRGDLLEANEQYYKELVEKNPNQKYYIMSDFKSIEETFKQYPNVVCYPKASYVYWENNLQCWWRDYDSVIDAFTGLLILSRTNIIETVTNSTFLKLCNFYRDIQLYEE